MNKNCIKNKLIKKTNKFINYFDQKYPIIF